MRTALFVVGIVVVMAPFGVQSQAPDVGGALGQQVRRPPPPTSQAPRLPDGTIDVSDGIWIGGGANASLTQVLKKGEELPLLPSARALMASRKETDDPYLWCLPNGVLRATPYPWRFVPNYTHRKPTHMFILYEGNIHSYRQIFMDGRAHPPDVDPTWYGHSIGWWEKDTLVIDTVGFNTKFWLDRQGTPHTERLHTVERWTRLNMGTLVNEVTIDDPGAFSRPFTLTFNARLAPPSDDIREYICQENNQYGIAGGVQNPFAR